MENRQTETKVCKTGLALGLLFTKKESWSSFVYNRCYGLTPLQSTAQRIFGCMGNQCGVYTQWALSPTKLVFWVDFSCLVCNYRFGP
ncbi:hypothetical protein HanRHA438_Chr06g0249441 [Helianthus annuus]|nr:hypothetical protein HanRHA438_Chr06g0249441 [Helianthus annuus]